MATVTAPQIGPMRPDGPARPDMAPPSRLFSVIFGLVLLIGLAYVGTQIAGDLGEVRASSAFPFVMLGVALLIALAFEFVNGFHDTANAVATVIYTHSLPAADRGRLVGLCNFLGVLLSTGAVAFGIVSLLPVELILKVGSAAPASRWCSRCSSPRSSGTSAPGTSACRPRARTR